MALLFFTIAAISSTAQVEVFTLDEKDEPIVGAVVTVLPDSAYFVSDAGGMAKLNGIDLDASKTLLISSIGYKPIEIDTTLTNDQKLVFHLQSKNYQLKEAKVIAEENKQKHTQSIQELGEKELRQNRSMTVGQTIEGIGGVNSLDVGAGISKPVIRGLMGNRVIVNEGGIRQEGQQWGQDHGLEIDPFSVEGIEVIKGAASLQYGSDAMGGVINIKPDAVPETGTFGVEIEQRLASVNDLWGKSMRLSLGGEKLFAIGRLSRQRYGDYRVPADSFIYNSYQLPIENNRLKNTAGEELSYEVEVGQKGAHSVSRLKASRYQLEAGFFAGAVGIPTSYNVRDDGNSRDIDIPKHEIQHDKISFTHLQYGKNWHWSIEAGWQQNQRAELSFPEFHNIPPDAAESNVGQFFKLQTYSINSHFELDKEQHKNTFGINAQMQNNSIDGFDVLLPAFETQRVGAFYIFNRRPENDGRTRFNAGLRADYGNNVAYNNKRFIYNSEGNIIDSLNYSAFDKNFYGYSASTGIVYQAGIQSWIKANLSKSYRIPYLNETSANGIHHGTFRHEQGRADLSAEHGYHLDLEYLRQSENYELQAAAYVNYFHDFIYLAPTSRFSPLPEAGQLYTYQQNNALYSGFEAEHSIKIRDDLKFTQVAEYVYSYEIQSGFGMPFTPPFNIKNHLTWHRHSKNNQWVFNARLQVQWVGRQNNVARNEKETPSYSLFNASIWGTYNGNKNRNIQWQISAANLFNNPYFNHLSRYRILNLSEPGRNIQVSLMIPLEWNL